MRGTGSKEAASSGTDASTQFELRCRFVWTNVLLSVLPAAVIVGVLLGGMLSGLVILFAPASVIPWTIPWTVGALMAGTGAFYLLSQAAFLRWAYPQRRCRFGTDQVVAQRPGQHPARLVVPAGACTGVRVERRWWHRAGDVADLVLRTDVLTNRDGSPETEFRIEDVPEPEIARTRVEAFIRGGGVLDEEEAVPTDAGPATASHAGDAQLPGHRVKEGFGALSAVGIGALVWWQTGSFVPLALIGSAAGIGLLRGLGTVSRTEEAIRSIAASPDLAPVEGNPHVLQGRRNGRPCQVRFRSTSRGSEGRTVHRTLIEIPLPDLDEDVRLRILPQEDLPVLNRWFGSKGLDTGDLPFDERFFVSAQPESLAQRVLDEDVREALLAVDDPGELEAKRGLLTLEWSGHRDDRALLERAADALVALADRLEEAAPRTTT